MLIVIAVLLLIIVLSNPISSEILGTLLGWAIVAAVYIAGAGLLICAIVLIFALTQ